MGSGAGSPFGVLRLQWLLLFGLVGPVLGGARPGFQQTSHLSSYEIITPWRLTRERREAPRLHSKQVSYIIQAEGKEHIIHLERNNDLLPRDFVVYTYDKEGALISDHPDLQNHCHYRGYVEGVYNSSIALSDCFGLRGLLHIENVSYGIEPLQNSSHFEHIFYRMDDVHKEPLKCGVFNKDIEKETINYEEEEPPSITQLLRRRRAVLPQTRYVELFIVVDKERYDMMGRNQTAVREEMIRLANYLDSMYIMLNIRIVLVGLEIWTNGNLINIIGGAGDVLGNFVQWREKFLITRRRHDSAQLVLKKGFGGTAGMAFVGTVCSRSHAGGINVFGQITVETFASIVAHELGHNLGMNHDDGRDCFCGAKSCIMNSGASSVNRTLVVKEVLVNLNHLLNAPTVTVVKTVGNALCGKLQCENVQEMPVFGIVPAIIQTPSKGTKCWGVDFQLGSDVPDPGMVNEGTRCDDGKICRNFQCVNASVLNYDCDIQKKCHGHGVCNSNKNCHCENGWAPPNCETKGYGGSVDSGPTYNEKNTALRDGLLVFFFAIVPLIVFAAFVFIKRDQLWKSYFRKKRSQTYESDGKNQAKSSRQPPSVPRHVSSVTPPREVPIYANRFPVPTYAAQQPQQFPSRPPPPQPKVSSQGNLIPARPAPAPPLFSSLT
uniref:ADAM metallopeptidase domain 9 n=1 Tax=Ursus maritimus TaxID=29073 RepID=A0A384BQH6_URSMA